jgi:hypothetical protein
MKDCTKLVKCEVCGKYYIRINPKHLATTSSHHLGVLDSKIDDIKILTAGIHVHFSNRDSITGSVIELPIEKIVRKMDEEFESIIKDTNRNLGEWEPKAHGFEYRSLPANADVYKILKKSFEILRNV